MWPLNFLAVGLNIIPTRFFSTKCIDKSIIFLDIQGSFEKFWHSGLEAILKQIGIVGTFLELFVVTDGEKVK